VVVLVAAYDEAARIGATLEALGLAFPNAQAWVADDGSRDATAEIARRAGARVVRSPRVIGKGGAMSAAAEAALAAVSGAHAAPDAPAPGGAPAADGATAESPIFVLCDGDLADSASELGPLVDAVAAGAADVAVAVFARRVGGGAGIALGFARWAIHRRCGLRTLAPISGQRALSAAALRDVLPFADGYGMEIGMTIDAVRAGHHVAEVELDLTHRATGRTLAGFLHRGRQLVDFVRAYRSRRPRRARNLAPRER
jgi:glycosyltransferase involved in cell wall biosynthesis